MKTKQEMWMRADELGIPGGSLTAAFFFNLKNTNAGNYIQYLFVAVIYDLTPFRSVITKSNGS